MTRPSRRTLVLSIAALTVAGLAVGLPLTQPWRLFTDTVVDESLPGPGPLTSSAAPPGSMPSSRLPSVSTAPSSPAPRTVSAPQSPTVLARGRFVSHEHHTRGTVAVLELADGNRVLRIEGLDTSDGPDLEVWLTDAAVVEGRKGWRVFDDGRYVDLGDLKGNKGNQNYPIAADVDLSAYRSVSIWCDRFNVSFGAAELRASPAGG